MKNNLQTVKIPTIKSDRPKQFNRISPAEEGYCFWGKKYRDIFIISSNSIIQELI